MRVSARLKRLRIENLMTRRVMTVATDTSLADAAHLLVTNHISGLPVVDDAAAPHRRHHRS